MSAWISHVGEVVRRGMQAERMTHVNSLFRQAVVAMEHGDADQLAQLLHRHPELARERLQEPGTWLRDQVGRALDDFFQAPYLLWFVAEDPVRTGTLPSNIADIARLILDTAARTGVLPQDAVDFALRLVCWSSVARDAGVQLALIDVLLDAGAATDRQSDNALVNGNFAAAEHLLRRGAQPTLATSLCLDLWDDVARLAPAASAEERQFALVLAALNGRADGVARLLPYGVNVNAPSRHLYAHGTPLHHAVGSGSLPTVQRLVDAGAALDAEDTVYRGTPLGWAEYYEEQHSGSERAQRYSEIAAYLRGRAAPHT